MHFVTIAKTIRQSHRAGMIPERPKAAYGYGKAHGARALDANINCTGQWWAGIRGINGVNVILARGTAPKPETFRKLRQIGAGGF